MNLQSTITCYTTKHMNKMSQLFCDKYRFFIPWFLSLRVLKHFKFSWGRVNDADFGRTNWQTLQQEKNILLLLLMALYYKTNYHSLSISSYTIRAHGIIVNCILITWASNKCILLDLIANECVFQWWIQQGFLEGCSDTPNPASCLQFTDMLNKYTLIII
jgi:hypothetical protein